MELEEFNRHFSDAYTQDIKRFARRALLSAGFDCLIVPDKENKSQAYCTHCGKMVSIPENNKHTGSPRYLRRLYYYGSEKIDLVRSPDKIQMCPACKNKYSVYHEWRMDMSSLNGTISISIWAKSKIDKNAITMRRIEIDRSYFNDTKSTDRYHEVERYLFRPGEKALRTKDQAMFYSWAGREYDNTKRSGFIKNVVDRAAYTFSFANPDPIQGNYFMDMSSFEHAIKDTPYQYCVYKKLDLSHYDVQRGFMEGYPELLVQYIELFSKCPWVEVLVKNGMENIIEDKLQSKAYPNILNWRAKSLARAIFRYTKKDLTAIKKYNGRITSMELYLLLEIRKYIFPGLEVEDVIGLKKQTSIYSILDKVRHFKFRFNLKLEKFKTYCAKQNKLTRQTRSVCEYLLDWMDYVEDATKLKLNLQESENLWPKNLAAMHANIISQIEIKKDENLNRKIRESLEWRRALFLFESSKYLIRPAESTQELIAEGKMLHHCVGGYANRYASETTNILFMRRKEFPDNPFVTLEVIKESDNHYRLIQVRANMNKNPLKDATKVVNQFMNVVNERAENKKERVRIA